MNNTELYNIEAEVELLGMLVQDNNRIDSVDWFLSDYFYLTIHGDIFNAIKTLIDKKVTADIINIESYLQKNEQFIDVGGKMYLLKIQQTISMSTIRGRAELIYALYQKRLLIETLQKTIEDANKADFLEIKNVITKAESDLYQLTKKESKHQELVLSDLIDNAVNKINTARKRKGDIIGISSGYRDIDEILCGFKNGELYTIGATVSMGKTAILLNIAYNMILNGVGVGFFSLEMSAEALIDRLLAMHTDYNSMSFSTGTYIGGTKHGQKINDSDFEDMVEKIESIRNSNIRINHRSTLNIQQLYSQTRLWIKKYKIQVLMVDYIQIIDAVNKNNKNSMRYIDITEITNGLKAIAKDFNIPVIALAQVNRDSQKIENKKPKLVDLSESSSIEKSSDVIMFLYREAYYVERNKPEDKKPYRSANESAESFNARMVKYTEWEKKYDEVKNKAEIIIAKNRNGAIGNVELYFDKTRTKFSDKFRDDLIVVQEKVDDLIDRKDWNS